MSKTSHKQLTASVGGVRLVALVHGLRVPLSILGTRTSDFGVALECIAENTHQAFVTSNV